MKKILISLLLLCSISCKKATPNEKVEPHKVYYRLKIVDKDGATSYSYIKAVTIN